MMVLRVHGDDLVFSSSLHSVPPRIPQMNMMKVHIPFTFKLLETSKSSYNERIMDVRHNTPIELRSVKFHILHSVFSRAY
ncbi:hypothetical protein HHI36_001831 [Cryptolaemus montrouzieri]|uniref:Uncharacterized protein n=1 Tax=Cryptolaemus montrouzieri TaxID=559131 RepID=A0ABD2P9F4_9CUCU